MDVVTNEACTYYSADNPDTPTDSRYYVVQGHMTLYLRENTALSSTSESSGRALKLLQTAINKDTPSSFLGDAGDLGTYGILGASNTCPERSTMRVVGSRAARY